MKRVKTLSGSGPVSWELLPSLSGFRNAFQGAESRSVSAGRRGCFGWLPQLNTRALWIHDPAELTVLVALFRLAVYVTTVFAQLGEHCSEVFHPEVEHELSGAGVEIFGVIREWAPDCVRITLWVALFPGENGPTPVFNRNTQVVAIPVG